MQRTKEQTLGHIGNSSSRLGAATGSQHPGNCQVKDEPDALP
ncbi:MAG: hypothetical protein ACOVQX_07345 [Legionella sp.]